MKYLSFGDMRRGVRKLFLLLVMTFAVCLGLKNALKAEDSAVDAPRSAGLVVMTDSAWFDDFYDASGLSALEGIQISADDQLVLDSDALLGSATSIPISPTLGVQSWGQLYFTATVPLSTALAVNVLDATDTPLMHNVPNGGSLAGIDAETHPVLKLRVTLSSTVAGQTPRLDEWRLNWIPDYPSRVFLPIVANSSGGSTPPPLGAAIGFTGAHDESAIGKAVRFPSLRKNDAGWDSSFAIQNIAPFATTLTLEFFREDGTLAYAANGIPLRPYGTYIASLANFPSLADGSYALAATTTETIVGMASTRHAAGRMAVAYNGTSQGGRQILVPLVFRGQGGWMSRVCVHNMTPRPADAMMYYYDQSGTVVYSLQIDIPGNGVDCANLGQAPWLPFPFMGTALVTSEDTDLAVTDEDVHLQRNLARGYLGFDLSAGSDTIYIPRCWKKWNGWPTSILVANVGSSASNMTVSYHEFDGRTGYTRTYPPGTTGFSCPESTLIEPPLPPYRLGSAVASMSQSELMALATDANFSSGTDMFSYPCPPVSSSVVYVPNVGGGPDNWSSTLSIQNPNAVTNTVTMSFYNRAGDVQCLVPASLPPYGMGQYEVTQLPGLSASYEGSAIISATMPVAVWASKER